MIQSRARLHERMKGSPEQERSLVITPRPQPEAFDADAVDLRLGTYFLLPSQWERPLTAPFAQGGGPALSWARVHVPIGEYLVIPAHQTVLGATLEFLKLPSDLSGEVLTKSSIARTFVVVETAPWIHPNYRGCLTLEIANVSNTPVLLYPGTPICQLVLLAIEAPEGVPERLGGQYIGPVFPEEPTLPCLGSVLRPLGTGSYRVVPPPQRRPVPAPPAGPRVEG